MNLVISDYIHKGGLFSTVWFSPAWVHVSRWVANPGIRRRGLRKTLTTWKQVFHGFSCTILLNNGHENEFYVANSWGLLLHGCWECGTGWSWHHTDSSKTGLMCRYKRVFGQRIFHSIHSGTQFADDFLLTIQIRWKLPLAVKQLLTIRSQKFFAHAMTAVQNFVVIMLLKVKWEQKKFHRIWIAMENP